MPKSSARWMPSIPPSRSSWARDDQVFVAGIDVAEGGNVFGLMRGLHDTFGDRVRDTPISETAILGLGVGAAMAGMRPVVELMYLDFVGVCLDQLLNQAAKMPFMTGGTAEMALTVRTQFGAGRSSGSQHSQSLEALLAHIPGLSVVMPSTPADTYGLLRAAIQDPNPVIFIENRLLYGMKGPQPDADYLVPIGRSAVVRQGSDLTVVSVSRMVHEALAAAETLAGEGLSVEVIDLRTVAPLDMAPILESVHKTSRLLIAHEAVTPFGIGAEIAATVALRRSGTSMRRSSGSAPHRRLPRMRRVWNGSGCPTARTSSLPSGTWPRSRRAKSQTHRPLPESPGAVLVYQGVLVAAHQLDRPTRLPFLEEQQVADRRGLVLVPVGHQRVDDDVALGHPWLETGVCLPDRIVPLVGSRPRDLHDTVGTERGHDVLGASVIQRLGVGGHGGTDTFDHICVPIRRRAHGRPSPVRIDRPHAKRTRFPVPTG